MRHSHTKKETKAANVNLTPLIDMVFILLIFFMVTASFTKESGIEDDRPTAETTIRQEQASLIISINKEGEIWIDNKHVDIRSIRAHIEQLHAQNPEGTVIIMADKNALTGTTVSVLDQVRLSGVSNVAISATKK